MIIYVRAAFGHTALIGVLMVAHGGSIPLPAGSVFLPFLCVVERVEAVINQSTCLETANILTFGVIHTNPFLNN